MKMDRKDFLEKTCILGVWYSAFFAVDSDSSSGTVIEEKCAEARGTSKAGSKRKKQSCLAMSSVTIQSIWAEYNLSFIKIFLNTGKRHQGNFLLCRNHEISQHIFKKIIIFKIIYFFTCIFISLFIIISSILFEAAQILYSSSRIPINVYSSNWNEAIEVKNNHLCYHNIQYVL